MEVIGNASGSEKRGSIVRRFHWALFILYLVAVGISAPTIYIVTSQQVHARAERELAALVDMVQSIQEYVAQDLRPFFLEHGLFYSPGFSGIVATSRIAGNFKKLQPAYYIKNASDNPLNPANTPEPVEMELLNRFRLDRELDHWTQVGIVGENRLLISASPKVSKKGCLQCHGARENVPKEISDQFPGFLGYNYKPDAVVGVSVVGVPIEDVKEIALQRTGVVLGLLTVLFAIAFFAINMIVKRSVLNPIIQITEVAHAISRGKLETPIEMARNDEIGDLGRSVELVRRSFDKVMQRMRKPQQ